MAVLWLVSALYLTSFNKTHFLKDSGAPKEGNGDIYVRAELGNNATVKGIGDFSGQRAVFRFMGIPYARPPTGALRFKKPEPVDGWAGERDATKPGHQCPQTLVPGFTDFFNTSEDCLFLNVYTPTRDSTHHNIPVMVWIHGGGYSQMAGSVFDGSALAEKGVVVVTFNYRLGALGFLSTEDDVIPGNFGLLDQIQALKWVKQYISNFGGDPNQVTIFGVSAGGTSVSLLTQSPLARGLFHRAIMQSGVSLTPWAYVRPTTHITPRTLAKLIAEDAGCTQDISEQLLHCLQATDAETILNSSIEIVANNSANYVMAPRVENIYGSLPDFPSKLLENGQFHHVDTIRGYTAYESGLMIPQATKSDFRYIVFSHLAPFNITDTDYFTNVFSDIYLGNSTDTDFTTRQVTAVSSDLDFAGPTFIEIRHAVEKSPEKHHFFYKFDYRPIISRQPAWVTATHGDDLPFLFGFSKFVTWPKDQRPTPGDQQMAEQLMALWTNFAKSGDPTATMPLGGVSWEPFTVEHQQQLILKKISTLSHFEKPEIVNPIEQLLQKIDDRDRLYMMK